MNNSPDVIETMNDFPVKTVNGRQVFLRDVAHVHDGFQTQTNLVTQNGAPGRSADHPQDRRRCRRWRSSTACGDYLPELQKQLPKGVDVTPLFDQSVFVRASLQGVVREGAIAAGLTALMILLFLGNWRLTLIVMLSIPTSILCALDRDVFHGPDAQHHDAGRICPGGRNPGGRHDRRHREHRSPPGAWRRR